MYKGLHRINIPASWYFVALYALSITAFCELVHYTTSSSHVDNSDWIETIHLEVLLPAFTIGCVVKNPHEAPAPQPRIAVASSAKAYGGDMAAAPPPGRGLRRQSTLARLKSVRQDQFKFYISAVFMVLVGLSMPSLFNDSASAAASAHRRALASAASSIYNSTMGSGDGDDYAPMAASSIVFHVAVCTILMNVGKLFPAFCYRDEVNLRTRIALAIGMMPRGEVCAGIIVNAIALGVTGVSITIAVLCLAVNMTCVSGFIFAVKTLAGDGSTASSTAPTTTNLPAVKKAPVPPIKYVDAPHDTMAA